MAYASDTQTSPISQVLKSLGLTREDLHRRSDQMRQFLTAEHSLRVLGQDSGLRNAQRSMSTSNSFTARPLPRSRDASMSLQISPPATPVKSEPDEGSLPSRHFDSMEMVIERNSRKNKRERKGRKERSNTLPSVHRSPSPTRVPSTSYPGFNLDTFMQSRDVRRVSVQEPPDSDLGNKPQVQAPPITPQRGNYYRNHSTNEASTSRRRKNVFSPRPQTPTPIRSRCKSTTVIPSTPIRPRGRVSSFPSSSPPPSSSPFSSPTKLVVDTVSSPGPMPPLPLEEDYDELPYTIPPGPYSTKKPDLSYAALVGQAILSSPAHRLTLQEIYDWITIVYPHFQREETTWMNSIRHVLSTTVCFRKVVRERAAGRTLWAIWDEDLPCFEGGGFKKHLCKDMGNGRSKSGSGGRVKKRNRSGTVDDAEGEGGDTRKAKRAKKEKAASGLPPHPYGVSYMLPAAHHSLPLFPPTRPTPQHQPYYASCVSALQVMPSEVIFPPLPPGVNYGYHSSGTLVPPYGSGYTSSSSAAGSSANTSTSASTSQTPSMSAAPEETPVPDLTPNLTSSPGSPLLASEASSSQLDYDSCKIKAAGRVESGSDFDDGAVLKLEDNGVFDIGDSLEPGMLLLDKLAEERERGNKVKGKRKVEKAATNKALVLPPMPTSPSLNRRSRAARNGKVNTIQLPFKRSPIRSRSTPPPERPTTPVPEPCTPPPRNSILNSAILTMTTPPRNHVSHGTSSIHTPLSHQGLHMSPSPSLAHYKSHLDPPPAASFAANGALDADDGELEPENSVLVPPRKRTSAISAIFPPVTPKRLMFPVGQDSPPFRTPLGRMSVSAVSPFRTPGSRGISDPHDPGALLDEELSRLGAVGQFGYDSPTGLFGKDGEGLLYESPSVPSPGRWTKWW